MTMKTTMVSEKGTRYQDFHIHNGMCTETSMKGVSCSLGEFNYDTQFLFCNKTIQRVIVSLLYPSYTIVSTSKNERLGEQVKSDMDMRKILHVLCTLFL